MSRDYWLGVATIPALALVLTAAFFLWIWVVAALARVGIAFEVKWRRGVDKISQYVLRNNIWWERAYAPVFAGGWYREPPRYREPTRRLFSRWVGIGRKDGPCLLVFRSRDLGPTDDAPD